MQAALVLRVGPPGCCPAVQRAGSSGVFLYWGECWQSTLSGLKSEDFSYMEPLRFDEKGIMQRMKFMDTFELTL